MTLDIIDSATGLAAFQPEWSSFTARLSGQTPFQTPEWLTTWWRNFGSGLLRVFVFRERAQIAGIIPCFLHLWQGCRQLTLIGSGISDYLEPAISPNQSSSVLELLESHLRTNPDWDLCNWQDLSLDTPIRRIASAVRDDTPCWSVALTGSFDQYWASRSKSLRQNVRRDRQKAESQGSLEFAVTSKADPEPLNALIGLHAARWQQRGEPGMIQANRSAAFLRDIAGQFAERDRLRIFYLRFNGEIAAVICGICYANTLFNYLTAFDPEHASLGLGRTLLYESVRYCFENGYKAWDFLRGDEPYKAWWDAGAIPKCRVIVKHTA